MSLNLEQIFDDLYSKIEKMNVVDVHNHLNPVSLSIKSFEDVIFYHYIVTELATSGMPSRLLNDLKGLERLKAALPYMKFLRNTSTFWALKKILLDLYGLDISTINEDNVANFVKVLEERREDEAWAKDIIRNYAHVKRSILTLSPIEDVPKYDSMLFTGSLRMDPVIPNLTKETIKYLEQAYDVEVNAPKDLEEVLSKMFKSFSTHIVSATVNVQPDDYFFKLHPSPEEVKPYLFELKNVGVIDAQGRQALSSYLFNHMLKLCGEYGLTVQLMLGVKRPVPGASPPDYAITVFNSQQLLDLALLFAKYPETNFDIFIADSLLSHPLTVFSKNYPNVFLTGYWWYSMYPEIIRSYLRVRLQMLPYNKLGGFFSDAYVADWVYGKAVLAKRQIAHVLTEMVAEKYIDKDLAYDIAEAILYENAKKVYRKI